VIFHVGPEAEADPCGFKRAVGDEASRSSPCWNIMSGRRRWRPLVRITAGTGVEFHLDGRDGTVALTA
jgi:hypothetical protein